MSPFPRMSRAGPGPSCACTAHGMAVSLASDARVYARCCFAAYNAHFGARGRHLAREKKKWDSSSRVRKLDYGGAGGYHRAAHARARDICIISIIEQSLQLTPKTLR